MDVWNTLINHKLSKQESPKPLWRAWPGCFQWRWSDSEIQPPGWWAQSPPSCTGCQRRGRVHRHCWCWCWWMNSESPYCLVLDILLTDASGSIHVCTIPGKHKHYEIMSLFATILPLCDDSSLLFVCAFICLHSYRCKIMRNFWRVNIWQVFEWFWAYGLARVWKMNRWANKGCSSSIQQCPAYSYQE